MFVIVKIKMFPNGRLIMKYDRTIIFLIMFFWIIISWTVPIGSMDCYHIHAKDCNYNPECCNDDNCTGHFEYYYTIAEIPYGCPTCSTFYFDIEILASYGISIFFACFMTAITVFAISFIIFIYNKWGKNT